jgi:hypothetical protein
MRYEERSCLSRSPLSSFHLLAGRSFNRCPNLLIIAFVETQADELGESALVVRAELERAEIDRRGIFRLMAKKPASGKGNGKISGLEFQSGGISLIWPERGYADHPVRMARAQSRNSASSFTP